MVLLHYFYRPNLNLQLNLNFLYPLPLCYIICHSINAFYFLLCNFWDGNTTHPGKTISFRHRINNQITACRYGISINKFDGHVFTTAHVAKESYFENHSIMSVNYKNKLLFCEPYLYKLGYNAVSC